MPSGCAAHFSPAMMTPARRALRSARANAGSIDASAAIESPDGHLVVEVRNQRVRLRRGDVEIRTEVPDHWSVVVRTAVLRPTPGGKGMEVVDQAGEESLEQRVLDLREALDGDRLIGGDPQPRARDGERSLDAAKAIDERDRERRATAPHPSLPDRVDLGR